MSFVAITPASERPERQLRESHRQLHVLANIDALNRVPNRRHFLEPADLTLHADAPGSTTLRLLDVDHFKDSNDHLGHAVGDRFLLMVSDSLVGSLRPRDVTVREGGDEFVQLLRQTGIDVTMGVAGRIVTRLELRARSAAPPSPSLSLGNSPPLPGEPVDDALPRAYRALSEAKRQGRSRALAAHDTEDEPVSNESQRLRLAAC
jgi:diguanylate cyclase